MKATVETVKTIVEETATRRAVKFFRKYGKNAVQAAKEALEEHKGDKKVAVKAFIAELRTDNPEFKTTEKDTDDKRAYDAFRMQIHLLTKEDKETDDKPYDAAARFEAIMKEAEAHGDLLALLKKQFKK